MAAPLTCPSGHAMDEGYFHCPACGAFRPSARDPRALIRDGRVVGVKPPRERLAYEEYIEDRDPDLGPLSFEDWLVMEDDPFYGNDR